MYVLVILIIKRIQFYKINHVQETVVNIISKLVQPHTINTNEIFSTYLLKEVFIDNKKVKQ